MTSHSTEHDAPTTPTSKDPVCGMDVDPATSSHTVVHDGDTFHFCSARCQAKFESDPGQYAGHGHAHAGGGDATVTPDAEVAEYTCPMHPEIRQAGPGSCPICGMALEPVLVTADTGPNTELLDMTRRFWVGVVLSIPVLILGMGGDLVPALHDLISPRTSAWVQLVLATPVVLWAGWPFFQRGWTSVRTRHLNMFTLIAMGTGVAWLFSVVATVAPGVLKRPRFDAAPV